MLAMLAKEKELLKPQRKKRGDFAFTWIHTDTISSFWKLERADSFPIR